MGDLGDFHEVVQFLLRTKAFPHIDQQFTLREAKQAQEFGARRANWKSHFKSRVIIAAEAGG